MDTDAPVAAGVSSEAQAQAPAVDGAAAAPAGPAAVQSDAQPAATPAASVGGVVAEALMAAPPRPAAPLPDADVLAEVHPPSETPVGRGRGNRGNRERDRANCRVRLVAASPSLATASAPAAQEQVQYLDYFPIFRLLKGFSASCRSFFAIRYLKQVPQVPTPKLTRWTRPHHREFPQKYLVLGNSRLCFQWNTASWTLSFHLIIAVVSSTLSVSLVSLFTLKPWRVVYEFYCVVHHASW